MIVAKVTTILALVFGLLSGLLYWRLDSAQVQNRQLTQVNTGLQTALTTQVELRETEQRIAQQHSTEVAALKETQRITNAKLRKSLAANATWSAQMVPAGVVDALGM